MLGREPALPDQEQDQDGAADVAEEVGRAGRRRDRAQPLVPGHVAQAPGNLLAHRGPWTGRFVVRFDRWLGAPDPEDEDRREHEAQRIEEDRDRGLQDPDEDAGRARAEDLGRRAGDLQLRVALDKLVAIDDRWQVALVGDIEEDGQAAGHEPDDVQLPDCQSAEHIGDRDGDQGDGPAEVADDQDGPTREPIHPHAGRQAQEDERQEFDCRQQPEFEGRHLQDRGCHQGQREAGDLTSELAHGLGRPELQEVGMAQEAAGRRATVKLGHESFRGATGIRGAALGEWEWIALAGRVNGRSRYRRRVGLSRYRPC